MEFFNEYIPQLILSKTAPDILRLLVSLSLYDKSYNQYNQAYPTCSHRVLRLILEHAIHLCSLAVLTDIDDIDAAFVDVPINAPLQTLELKNASDVTLNAIGQLGNSLTKLVVKKCNKITNDG